MTKDEFWESLANLMYDCRPRDIYFYKAALDELLSNGGRDTKEIMRWAAAKEEYEVADKEIKKWAKTQEKAAKILSEGQEYWG